MRIDIPHPQPRESGDYQFYVTSGYGDPAGTIWLDETQCLTLSCLTAEDCDRLIRAAVQVKDEILAYTAEMTVPHGTKHLYKGTCQLCGKPEDDGLHAEPAPSGNPRPVVRVPGPHPDESAFRKGYAPDETAAAVTA